MPSPPPAGHEELRAWLADLVAGDGRLGQVSDEFAALIQGHRLATLAVLHGASHARFAQVRRQAFARTVVEERAARRVIDLLDAAGIRAVCHKGPPLAAQAWGDATARDSVDVDLLVRACDLPQALGVLSRSGYRYASRYAQWYERVWQGHVVVREEGRGDQPKIELHHTFTRPLLARVDMDELLREAVTVEGAAEELPAPSLDWQLVLASAHAVHHFFDPRGLLDVALLGTRLGDEAWQRSWRIARRAVMVPALSTAVAASAAWLAWAPPAWVDHAGRSSAGRRLADAYLRRYPPTHPVSGLRLQLGKLLVPFAMTSGWRPAAGLLLTVTDRPNVATALEHHGRELAGHLGLRS